MHTTVSDQMPTRARASRAAALLVAVIALTFAASAIAAHPKKGAHFRGTFPLLGGINGFKPPVTFTVSKSGTALTRFTYSTLGCFGAGGFQPGVDYYTKPQALMKLGTVNVSHAGRFSASGIVTRFTGFGFTTTTTSKISGRFTASRRAQGTVSFTQKLSGKGTGSCSSPAFSFTVKA